jgi:hypothetical protein
MNICAICMCGGGKAERHAVADALRALDITDGSAPYYPAHRIKCDSKGLRETAGLVIVQWQHGTLELAVGRNWPSRRRSG